VFTVEINQLSPPEYYVVQRGESFQTPNSILHTKQSVAGWLALPDPKMSLGDSGTVTIE